MTSLTDNQQQIRESARQILALKPVYLDTETTGIGSVDEIVEISVIDHDGAQLFSKLVKPTRPIPPGAERIHGISNRQVADAQPWPILWPELRSILYGRTIAAYNSSFDARLMEQTHSRYRLPWRERLNFLDVMQLFSDFRAVWDPFRKTYRYFKLAEAGAFFQIDLLNAHRSSADALLTRAVLHSIAGLPY
ncbi:MAG TPA: 3'-5' exonuclease [Anaerolineaceae bacterium]|nr:3'-5' exonuclease [Chloroflexota bacterium]HNR00969.1 3'-5' exonuclease [Anaerolineaceae bacterium]HNS06514.1 3'-5' exonuclease [Anaerolineaceae bacterium]HNW13911.1 3'-5' exonuclease [Anaerolineaceae bacterium]HOE03045.1 3'-5' exonuclease [Anaerolineaceae bacterium]